MAALESYFFSQTCSKLRNDGIEHSEVEMAWKLDFADLVKNAKSVAGFSPSHQFWVGPGPLNDFT